MLTRCLTLAALITAGLVFSISPASACPGCGPPSGQTLTSEVAQADFILFGTLKNPKQDPKDIGTSRGTTEMEIDAIVKPHDLVKGKKTFTIPRFIPPDKEPYKYMVFFNVVNGDIDPYRGEAVTTDSKLPAYVEGALKVRDKDLVTRMRYFFEHLESPELQISADAYNEFAVAEYKEVRPLAPKLPAETLLKWLKAPDTRASRYGLYGLLLGHCGKPEHAKELRALLDDKEARFSSGLDGMLMGYILLDPKAGYEFLMALVRDPKNEFLVKHGAMRALRFFWEYRPEILTRKQMLDGMSALMVDPDLTDMPIDDLRKWKAWEMTGEVLKYADKEPYNTLPINMRAIIKFAIAASWADPKNEAAAAFVAKMRKETPNRVKQLEDLLRDDMRPLPPPPPPKKK
ncbi:MAG: hypothetical protein L0241_18755 [Planctomycetia bacterium]|nr:hypothetical protein [Planctomycetia bacterium]